MFLRFRTEISGNQIIWAFWWFIVLCFPRAIELGKDFMMKQELIDAAEASGLSTMPIE